MSQIISRRNKKWVIISYAFFALFIFLSIYSYFKIKNFYFNIFSFSINEEITNNCPDCARRNIDGVLVPLAESNLVPVAVMIDNHSEARPAHGLASANLVYEAEVEGGITRILAFYASNDDVDEIGPIRSARPYYIDWAKELSAYYVHCGGSPEALAKILKEDVLNINEFYNANFFWRDKNLLAPHNIFTSLETLKSNDKYKTYKEGNYFSWIYKDDLIPENPVNPEILINFKEPHYAVFWKYDIINNNYIRHLNGAVDKTSDTQEIRSKNIILQLVESEVLDEKLRLKIKTIGKGTAIFCLDGECKEGVWNKKNPSTRTRYFIGEQEVSFNAGTTWIEIIRNKNILHY